MSRMSHRAHRTPAGGEDPSDGRFLSQADCRVLVDRVAAFRAGGGESGVRVESTWVGQTRYARNEIETSGDVLRNDVTVVRDIDGAYTEVTGNQIDDLSLLACVRRAERILRLTATQTGGTIFQEHFPENALKRSEGNAPVSATGNAHGRDSTALRNYVPKQDPARDSTSLAPGADRARDEFVKLGLALTTQTHEPYKRPTMFFGSTYAMDPHRRATAVAQLAHAAAEHGVLSAGYLETTAHGRAVMDTWGRLLYYPSTEARYSVTVRSADGSASGWAGVMWNDWSRVEPQALQAIALDKCLASRGAVRIEPGRYTTILEPQAVHQLFFLVMAAMVDSPIDRVDSRFNVTQDPMDPDCGFVPFDAYGNSLHATTWYTGGQLQRRSNGAIVYSRGYALDTFSEDRGRLFAKTYRLRSEHPSTPMPQMITGTQRGILVSRLLVTATEAVDPIAPVHVVHGYTRDGTWLIENGVVKHPVKNLRFRVSLEATFNNVEQIGVPQRVYTPEYPDLGDYAAVVPPVKIRDFAFTAVSDAV